jgi:AraC-like DNA-binding protein
VVLAGSSESNVRMRRRWTPCETLRPYVASFELRNDRLGTTRIYSPLPARTDCFLQFHLKQPYLVVTTSTGQVHRSPSRTLVGPHTRRREDLIWTGELKVFTIRFSPVGFRSIFGVPAEAIRNVATSSELVLGSAMLSLEALLSEAEDHRMPSIAEEFLLTHLAGQRFNTNSAVVLRMTAAGRRPGRRVTLDEIASKHNLGLRQMERLFQEFVGVSPKVFERLQRSRQALTLQRAHPDWDWSTIAAAAGYYDQAHLIREFRSQNGSTPVSFALCSRPANEFRSRS